METGDRGGLGFSKEAGREVRIAMAAVGVRPVFIQRGSALPSIILYCLTIPPVEIPEVSFSKRPSEKTVPCVF